VELLRDRDHLVQPDIRQLCVAAAALRPHDHDVAWSDEYRHCHMARGSPLPVYTGDSFALFLPFDVPHGVLLTPAFAGNPPCEESGIGLCDFDISWSETAGVLTAISISAEGPFDFIGGGQANDPGGRFGLTGGPLGSDGTIGGCTFTPQCIVSGFWQSDLPAVPEPMSAVLLLTGLLGTCLASFRSKSPNSTGDDA
jgi:hypothetical protein